MGEPVEVEDADVEFRCLACGEPPDYCQGHGDLAPCMFCAGWSTKHVWERSMFGVNIVCSVCHLLPLDADDEELPCNGGFHESDCDVGADHAEA